MIKTILYIDFDTRQCTTASNDFERDIFKLMNTLAPGKTKGKALKLKENYFGNNRAEIHLNLHLNVLQSSMKNFQRLKEILLNCCWIDQFRMFCNITCQQNAYVWVSLQYTKHRFPEDRSELLFTVWSYSVNRNNM